MVINDFETVATVYTVSLGALLFTAALIYFVVAAIRGR